ncbi:MAG: hypothetical protein F6K30_25020 [Cyanothece sp. SIO2G6]|nr:hypothetical protein [Cyanothece sp. SIO2G6]
MMDATPEPQFQQMVIGLLCHYSFETDRPLSLVVASWMRVYPSQWLVKAIVEALYQGRYKLVSVEQILLIWQRRGQPIAHFNHEFERIVCDRILDSEDVVQVTSDHDGVEQDHPDTNVAPDSAGNAQSAQLGHHLVAIETNDLGVEGVNKAIAPASAYVSNLGDLEAADLKAADLEAANLEVADSAAADLKTTDLAAIKAGTKHSCVPKPIHQFRPARAAVNVPAKLQAIAHNTTTLPST